MRRDEYTPGSEAIPHFLTRKLKHRAANPKRVLARRELFLPLLSYVLRGAQSTFLR